MLSASAIAHPNLAFIKYWGNRNNELRLPVNGSISMNLDGLETRTTVLFNDSLVADEVTINGNISPVDASARVKRILDEVRGLAGIYSFARVESSNNFPIGTGIASSASAFAALALAASTAAGLKLSLVALSRLARHGSGSACRSIPGGFVEWAAGSGDNDSFAVSIARPDYWDLTDCITMVNTEHKEIGSTEGHALASTSPLQSARVNDTPRRLDLCRNAILNRDFESFAEIVEADSNLMHAVMMTSVPPLFYWQPATLMVMRNIITARKKGLPVCYSIDAGPNVHAICASEAANETTALLGAIPGVQEIRLAKVGGPTRLVK
jgi:diphosphomevalonate decarboxylase